MKFFSMKKPAVRILLLVVLLGLAIFYFRYMREGFVKSGDACLKSQLNNADGKLKCTYNSTTKKYSWAASTADLTASDYVTDAGTIASGTFTEGSSCVNIGSEGKTEKTKAKTANSKTLYCCDGIWSSTAC